MPDLEPIVLKLDRSQVHSQVREHIADMNAVVDAARKSEQQQTAIRDEQGRLRDQRGRYLSDQEKARLVASGADAAALLKQRYSAEEAMFAAKNRRIDQLNEAAVQSSLAAIRKQEFAALSFGEKVKSVAGSIDKWSVAYTGLNYAASGVQAVAKMWADQRADIEASVLRTIDYETKLRELANLQGQLGKTGGVLAGQLLFRNVTGQTAEEAQAFQSGALNTGQASTTGGFIKQDQFDALLQKAGRYQAASGADPKAIGELTGILPQMIGTQGQSADDVFRRMVGIFDTLQLGGSDLGPAVRAFKENASQIGPGNVRSPEQLAAITSAFSVANSGKEATLVQQLLRTTNLGQLRTTKGTDGQPLSDYFKSIGATDQMDAVQVANLVADDVRKQQAGIQGQKNPDGSPKQLNLQQYFRSKGFEGEESITPLTEFGKGIISGQIGKTFGARMSPESAPTAKDANARAAAFANSGPAGARSAQLATDLADASKATEAERYYMEAKRLAFETLRADPKSGVYGRFEDFDDKNILNPWAGKVLDKVKEQQFAAARKAGVPVPDDSGGVFGAIDDFTGTSYVLGKLGIGGDTGLLGGSIGSRLRTSPRDRAMQYYDLAQSVRQANGNPLDNSELIAALKANTAATEKANQIAQQQAVRPGMQNTPTIPPAAQPGPPAKQAR